MAAKSTLAPLVWPIGNEGGLEMNEGSNAKPWRDNARALFTEWETRRNDPQNPAPELLKRLRTLAVSLPKEPRPTEPDPTAAILDAAHEVWKENPEDPAAMLAFLDKKKPQLLRPASGWEGAEVPRPILWRDNPEDRYADVVVSAGEVCLLSSAGGIGKSCLSLALAHAACTAQSGKDFGSACGLRIAPGRVGVVSYEDAPERIAARLKLHGSVPDGLYLWPDPEPLWQAEAERGGSSQPSDQWDDLWDQIRRIEAVMLIIDPASAALADVSTSETGPVRSFLRKTTLEARRAGCGVLIVAHNSKATRSAIAHGDFETAAADPAGGSAAWYDAARGVLVLARDPLSKSERVVFSAKANYGRTGWGARLKECKKDGEFGLKLKEQMTEKDVDEWQKEVRKKNSRKGKKPSSKQNPKDWEVD